MEKLNKTNKYLNIIIFIKALSSILGVILAVKCMFNSAVLLLMVCFLCSCFYNYYHEDKNTYITEFNKLTNLISYGIFPAIIAYRSSNLISINIVIPLYLIASLIRISNYNIFTQKYNDDKKYFYGLPIISVAIIFPIIYMLIFINYHIYTYVTLILFLLLSILYISNIKVKKINIKVLLEYLSEVRYSKYIRVLINFVLFPIFIIFISDLFFKTNSFAGFALFDAFKSIIHYPIAFIFVLVLFSLITLVLTCIFKRTNKAKFILIIIVAIFLTINDVKYIIMNKPVVLSDVNFLNATNMEMSALFITTVKGIWVIKVLIKFIMLILFGVLIKKSKLSLLEFKHKKSRVSVGFISLITFALIIYFSVKYSLFMVTKTYNTPLDNVYRIQDYGELYYNQGLFQGILFNTYSSKNFKPTTYDKNEVKDTLEKTYIEEENWGKPNIVVILSESFFDVSNLNEITFNRDLTSNIHKFEKMDDVLVTNTYVSTFGGSSVVSEWEVLTSASNQFNVSSYVPYTDYYIKKNIKNINKAPHIIKSLNKEGYITKYITPWSGESYNSEETYNLVGANRTIYNLKGDKKGMFLADYEINNSIISELSKNKDTPKLLIYATAQNHMPCSYDRYDHYDVDITSSTLNKDDTKLIRCYAQGVYDADKELGKLYEEIKEIDEDTIVIFFGDHLPFINNKNGKNSIKNSSYLNEKDKYLNNLHNYTTKGVVFSNYINKLDKSINYINLNYLSAYVYAHLDIYDKEYFNYINNVRKEIPVFSREYIYDPSDDTFTSTNKLSDKDKNIINEFRNVQYYEFFDKN